MQWPGYSFVQASLTTFPAGYSRPRGFLTGLCALLLHVLVLVPLTGGKVYERKLVDRIVTTQYGKLRGLLLEIPNPHLVPVEAYFGLQYASLQGGDHRFMVCSSPTEKWDGTRIVYGKRAVCPQRAIDEAELRKTMPYARVQHFLRLMPFLEDQTEECLNLNIYVPQRVKNDTTPLPVMVYIHGDSYSVGSGNAYDGSVLASYGGVIVITLNFRLGILGFLSSGDAEAPGNYAIWDIQAALVWIKNNIEPFGGDAQRVTLFGHGYGAALLNILMVSPVSRLQGKPLFQRAITLSGSALSTWGLSRHPFHYTLKLAERVNCSHAVQNSAELVACLKNTPVEELLEAEMPAHKYFTSFGPVVDGMAILPSSVEDLMTNNRGLSQIDLLTGVVKNEGLVFCDQNQFEKGITELTQMKIVRTYVRNVYDYHKQKIYDILLHQYSDWDRPEDNEIRRDNTMELLGDGQFVAPTIDFAKRHAGLNRSTYFYTFNYPTVRLEGSTRRWANSVHGDELLYIFGAPVANGVEPFADSYGRQDRMLSEAVMRYWTNFAKTGNPNQPLPQTSVHGGPEMPNRFTGLKWLPFHPSNLLSLRIAMRPRIRTHYKGAKMALWLELIPKIYNSDDLDPVYHLLDNYDRNETFEQDTRPLGFTFPPPPSPPTPPATTTLGSPKKTGIASPAVETPKVTPKPSLYPKLGPTGGGGSLGSGKPKNSTAAATGAQTMPYPMGIIVAVGGSLLFLNLIVLIVTCYQRRKMHREEKFRIQELELQKDLLNVHSEHLQNAKNSAQDMEIDSKGSTPLPTPPHRYTQHQMHPDNLTKVTIPHMIPPNAHAPTCRFAHLHKLSSSDDDDDEDDESGTLHSNTPVKQTPKQHGGLSPRNHNINSPQNIPNGDPKQTMMKSFTSPKQELSNHVHPTTVV
ncbi:neuroligin-4, X-linked isoform X2 [Lingula anatina]|uniref:Neuroligin-4, X-linked isoform X2 n=1 Tax=Lingula anatina TaxID=7574 RepID=A0A1S3KB75_LINAN|nr:neuroligin-4, X-linked isoform X2 [Lingula anatina]|eukprot:XP_013419689.1 neuroligin-4, X-linked isoform X2 [Lingula anatina]